MKILLSVTSLYHGGAERVITNLANSFIADNHEIEILTYKKSKIYYKLDERVKIICDEEHIKNNNIFFHIKWRRQYFKKSNADIVVSFLDQLSILNIISMIGINIPLIAANRNDPNFSPKSGFMRKVRNFLFKFTDKIVVQSQNNKKYFSEKLHEKISVIYNPISMGNYVGAALQCDKENKIVAVGRLTEQKNNKMLIDSFNRISKKYTDYKLYFYGDGILRNQLMDYVSSIGLENRIIFMGSCGNIFENIKNAKLFVLSSDYEGMSNALIEAMCLGLPCISTKVSGAEDVIKNGENGILIDCGNVQQLSEAMEKIIVNDSLQLKFAENAIKLYDKFKTEHIIKDWYDVILSSI